MQLSSAKELLNQGLEGTLCDGSQPFFFVSFPVNWKSLFYVIVNVLDMCIVSAFLGNNILVCTCNSSACLIYMLNNTRTKNIFIGLTCLKRTERILYPC